MTTTINANTTLTNLTKKLPNTLKPIASYIKLHESEGSLAHIRFAQDTITNWVPKAVLARSLADFTDMSFLELSENVLVYYGGKFLGENLFRKLYSKKLNAGLKEKVAVRAEKLLQEVEDKKLKTEDVKALMPVKAALAISALAIPLTEYSLNYIKNLMTVKVFKQADFNNIANLNKDKKEDIENQKRVKASAIKHIKLAVGIFAGCLGTAALLLTKGRSSKFLQSISETILAPGNKIFKPKSKDPQEIARAAEKAKTFNKYLSIDFDSVDVKDKFGNTTKKLALSTGQLMACVLIGFVGYLGAAKDRGKQNMLEVLFRYPIVTFYVITGADLFIKGFKSILRKKGGYENMVGKDSSFKTPSLNELPELAKKLAHKNGTSVEAEFNKLFKQKATIIGIPTIFSLLVMGFFVAGYSRFFTQYRYNKELEKKKQSHFREFDMTEFMGRHKK